MLFKGLKAIAIVKHIISEAEIYMGEVCINGYSKTNYYAYAECSLLALAKLFSNVYSKNEKLGNAIVKESLSGSWRGFVSQRDKEEYLSKINNFYDNYVAILSMEFNDDSLNPAQKISNAFGEICKSMANDIKAEYTEDSLSLFMLELMNLKEYVYAYCK